MNRTVIQSWPQLVNALGSEMYTVYRGSRDEERKSLKNWSKSTMFFSAHRKECLEMHEREMEKAFQVQE